MPKYFWIFLVSLLIKYISDYSFVHRIKNKFGIRKPIRRFTGVFLFHPFYVTIFGLLGLRGKFKWKEKTYRAKKE